jgi:tetratricopeptide (TPR) repeat protein
VGVEIDGDNKRTLQTALDELIVVAAPDSIIVSGASAPFLERRFDLAPAAAPAGSAGPSFTLTARERTGFGLWGRMGRFVGRSRELEFLRGRPGYATTGHGQVVALVGDAGVGKSRLLWEFLQAEWTPDRLVLETSAVSYGKGTSYLPVLDLLRGYFQLDSRDDPRQARDKVADRIRTLDPALSTAVPALLALLDVPVDEPAWLALTPLQRRERAHDAATLLIAAESRVRSVFLIFEDLHWADPETSALLDSLVAAVASLRALVVVTYRPGYEHGWGNRSYYTQIVVDPLSRDNMEELLDSLVGADPSVTPLRALLVDSAEGNPLFLEEMVRSLEETGTLSGAGPPYVLAKPVSNIQVPATVQDVLAARMDRLPADARHLLQCAAVIGRDIPFALLETLADLPTNTVRPLVAQLKAAGFLYETTSAAGPELSFRHALTHEMAYGSLLEYQQRELHARAVTLMEDLYAGALGEHADRLADHALRGGVWHKAVDYLRAAAGGAFGRGAVEESLNRYESAMSLLPRLASSPENLRRAIDVRIDLHSPLVVIGQLPRLIELHREAERLAVELGEPHRLARVFHRMAWYSWLSARHEDGASYARRSLDIATEIGDTDGQVLASHVLAQCLYSSGQHGLANELFSQTVDGPNAERAKRLLSITIPAYTSACGWLARSLAVVGDLDRAVAYGARGIQAAEDDKHPQSQAVTWTLAATPFVYRGDAAEAVRLAERALALCESKGLLTWLPGAIATLGWALVAAGRLEEALPYLERAPSLYETLGLRTYLSLLFVWWAEGLLLAGRIEEARDVALRAVETAVACGERGNEAEGLLVMANVLAASEPPDPMAATYYERVRNQAEELGMRPLLGYCHLGLGRFHLRSGARERGIQHLGQAATLFRAMGMRRALSVVEAELGA